MKKIPFSKAKELEPRITDEFHELHVKKYKSVQYWLDTKSNMLFVYSRGIEQAWFAIE